MYKTELAIIGIGFHVGEYDSAESFMKGLMTSKKAFQPEAGNGGSRIPESDGLVEKTVAEALRDSGLSVDGVKGGASVIYCVTAPREAAPAGAGRAEAIAAGFGFGGRTHTLRDGENSVFKGLALAERLISETPSAVAIVCADSPDPDSASEGGAATLILKEKNRAVADHNKIYACVSAISIVENAAHDEFAYFKEGIGAAIGEANLGRRELRVVDVSGRKKTDISETVEKLCRESFDEFVDGRDFSLSDTERWIGKKHSLTPSASIVKHAIQLFFFHVFIFEPEYVLGPSRFEERDPSLWSRSGERRASMIVCPPENNFTDGYAAFLVLTECIDTMNADQKCRANVALLPIACDGPEGLRAGLLSVQSAVGVISAPGAGSAAGSGAAKNAGSGAGSGAGSSAAMGAGSAAGSGSGSGAGSAAGSGSGSGTATGAGSRADTGAVSDAVMGAGSSAGRQNGADEGLRDVWESAWTAYRALPNPEYTAVLVFNSRESLNAEISEMLTAINSLCENGRFKTGGMYESRRGSFFTACPYGKEAKVVFMNPPGSMQHLLLFYEMLYFFPSLRNEYVRYLNSEFLGNLDGLDYRFGRFGMEMSMITIADRIARHRFGLSPDILTGASLGEIASLFCYDIIDFNPDPENGIAVMNLLQAFRDVYTYSPEKMQVMYMIGPLTEICRVIDAEPDVHILVDASPNGAFITGKPDAVDRVIENGGFMHWELNSSLVIHSPLVYHFYDPIYEAALKCKNRIKADCGVDIYSAISCKIVENTIEGLADFAATILTRRCNFYGLLEVLYEKGGRVFVDMSTGGACLNWAQETFADRDTLCFSIYPPFLDPMGSLFSIFAKLLANHVAFDAGVFLNAFAYPFMERDDIDRLLTAQTAAEAPEKSAEALSADSSIPPVAAQPAAASVPSAAAQPATASVPSVAAPGPSAAAQPAASLAAA